MFPDVLYDRAFVHSLSRAKKSVCESVCWRLTSVLGLFDGRRRGICFDSVVVSPSVYNQLLVCVAAVGFLANRWSTVPLCGVGRDIKHCGLPSLPAKLDPATAADL